MGEPPNREERRRLAREEVERYRAEGLPPRLSFPAMYAHTAHLRHFLERRDDPERAGRMAHAFHEGFERSMAHGPRESRVACRAGCTMCCHNLIGLTAPEVFAVAAEVAGRTSVDADRLAIGRAALAGKTMDGDARMERRLACPMLAGDLCSIYAVRPIACRAFFSLSLDACREVFDGAGEDIPAWRLAILVRGLHDRCMAAAIKAVGLPHGEVEMTEAVAIALADPQAQARWLGGEDIFAAARQEAGDEEDEQEELLLDVLIAGAAGRRIPANPWTQ